MSDAPPPGGYQPPQPPQPPPAPGYQPPTYQQPPAQPTYQQPPVQPTYQQPAYQQPAQFQPVNPGAKSGNGCLKAFLIIAGISAVLGVVVVVAAIFLVGNAVSELAGPADPADYEIAIDSCTVSEFGVAEATGTIKNLDNSRHGFTVGVDFSAEGSTTRIGGSSRLIDGLDPGQSEAWTVTSSVTGSPTDIECKVSSVDYFFS